MRLLLDMDCCLVDWIGGVARHWDVSEETLRAYWEPGQYGIYAPLAKALRGPNAPALSASDFWQRLNGLSTFWSGLEPLPWCQDLLKLAEQFAGKEVYLVTSPSYCSHSYYGKAEWSKTMFGRNYTKMIPTSHKHLLAKTGVVLIDDYEENIKDFEYDPLFGVTGGKGILFPCLHNGLHGCRGNPLPIVERALHLIAEELDAK